MSNSEWEDQQEANRMIESYGGLRDEKQEQEEQRSKYLTWQPPVTHISNQEKAAELIVQGATLLRAAKPMPEGAFSYVFAGKEADLAEAYGKQTASPVETARLAAAKNRAKERLQAAELEYLRRQR